MNKREPDPFEVKIDEPNSSSARERPRPRVLEKIVIAHFGSLLIFTAWAFGGQAPWVREVIAWWGGVGVLIFIAHKIDFRIQRKEIC